MPVISVAAVIDTSNPSAWIIHLVKRLQQRDCVKLTLVELVDASDAHDTIKPGGVTHRIGQWLLGKMDRPLFEQNPWHPGTLADIRATGDDLPLFRYTNSHTSDATNNDAQEALAGCEIIINLTEQSIPANLLPVSTAVIWDAHLETLNTRIEDALIAQGELVWVHLWEHRGEQSRRIATHSLPRQTFSATDLKRSIWFCLPMLFDSRLTWLANGAQLPAMEFSGASDGSTDLDLLYRQAVNDAQWLLLNQFTPSSLAAPARFMRIAKLFWSWTVERYRNRFYYEQWQLAFVHDQSATTSSPDESTDQADTLRSSSRVTMETLFNRRSRDYQRIDLPDDTWWADPHLFERDGQMYVFFEQMSTADTHGYLSVAKLDSAGQPSEATKILDVGSHLSYPHVFEHESSVYLIPESTSTGSVSLYKADEFPNKWSFVQNLLSDVDLADSTLHHDGKRFWMFCNSWSHRTVNERDELFLFYADSLTGPWQAHPLNPVVTGVDRARMAGPLIHDGRHWYRASQYGAKRYGYGINLHRIEQLDITSYSETTSGQILPDPSSQWLGCHSLSHVHGFTVIDRVTRRLKGRTTTTH